MTQAYDVSDIRNTPQPNPENRRAIRRSIIMAVVGAAAVAAAVLLANREPLTTVHPQATEPPAASATGAQASPEMMTKSLEPKFIGPLDD